MEVYNDYFGEFGGRYVAEVLRRPLDELEAEFLLAAEDDGFNEEVRRIGVEYTGRPTPLLEARNAARELGGARVFIKLEGLANTGAHKVNNVVGQALLSLRMGKKRIIAETGAGQHGLATAAVCAKLGLDCTVYMGEVDIARQRPNVFWMELFGAEVVPVSSGSQTLKDAVNEALRDWSANYKTAHYLLGTAAGPHPFPTVVREFQKMIGEEAKQQVLETEGRLPDAVIACVGGGSNAIGMFTDFIDEPSVKLIGVEPAGKGLDSGEHGATLCRGSKGILHGAYTYIMQTEQGQIEESYSVSAGLDYPAVGPQHAHLHESGRAQYVGITDDEALDAFKALARHEGIIPALESSHALAYALQYAEQQSEECIIVVNLSGRGDKDLAHVHQVLAAKGDIS